MSPSSASALVALLGLAVARPAGATEPPRGRLELQAGGGWRQDTVTQPLVDVRASGGALSDLGARAAWFGASHFGLAGRVRVARFVLTGTGGMASPGPLTLTGLDAAGGLAGRVWLGPLELEAMLGYGHRRVPVLAVSAGPAGDARFTGSQLRGHGPEASAGVRLALGDRVGIEVGADASYEQSRTNAGGTAVAIAQRQHHLGVGLRATWQVRPPPPAPAAAPPRPAPPPPIEVPPVVPAAISGVVRAEGGQAVIARISLLEAGLTTATDPGGGFRFDVPPGSYTLTIEAEGYLPQSKPVVAGPGEQRIYNVELRRPTP
jgi:hypothetical protein